MAKFNPPKPPFIGARHHGGSQTPKAIVIHGTVSPDNPGTARSIAGWWHGPTSPLTSAHYIVDPKEVIQAVGDHTVAFHCGFNTGSIAIELCDEQTGPATRWNDADSTAILERAAGLVAKLCLAYGIEVKRPSVSDLKKRGPHGIYGHNDSRLAFGHTSHTDPRDFPWMRFLTMVQAEVKKLKAEALDSAPPKPGKVKKPRVRVRVGHWSAQFSDTDSQHESDANRVFDQAERRGLRWVTGTEAGPGSGNLKKAIRRAAKRHGYRTFFASGTWVAVAEDQIKRGTWKTTWKKVLNGVARQFPSKGVCAVTFDTIDLGRVTVIAGHLLTKGRPTKVESQRKRLPLNRKIMKAIGKFAKESARGKSLVFYGGDQNINDRLNDTFFGQPLTSLADELKKWPNTGHGPIDVIASMDGDGRVVGLSWKVATDKAFELFGDHYFTEGEFGVVPI